MAARQAFRLSGRLAVALLDATATHQGVDKPHAVLKPISGLHPLRTLSTAVQVALQNAQSEHAADNFVGSDLHQTLSKKVSYLDPDVHNLQAGCAEWHQARRNRVTASAVARATGLLPMYEPASDSQHTSMT